MDFASAQRVQVEIIARRRESGFDSLLTIFDAEGRKLSVSDDAEGTDSKVDTNLPAGQYFLVVRDAHDHGGPTYPYRLIVQH